MTRKYLGFDFIGEIMKTAQWILDRYIKAIYLDIKRRLPGFLRQVMEADLLIFVCYNLAADLKD